MSLLTEIDKLGLQRALAEAHQGYQEGGIPIGAAIIHWQGSYSYKFLGSGHNQRIQKASPTLHGEMAALEDAGRMRAKLYKNSIMYTTLSPCSMCTGAILLYQIPRVVIGENINFQGDEDLLRSRGVEVVVVNDEECTNLMKKYIEENPEVWFEDIGQQGEK